MDPIFQTEIRKVLRVKKEDSAFVYTVFEASEGLGSYSTLPHQLGDAHRDLELRIPITLLAEAQLMLDSIQPLILELESERIEPSVAALAER
jgi:hypothetical protein